METSKTDKFYTFLCSALGALARLLDIALADDVAKVTFDHGTLILHSIAYSILIIVSWHSYSNSDITSYSYSILKRFVVTCQY